MSNLADWFLISGVFLVLTGCLLRMVTMMRASDAISGRAPYGRELIQQHRSLFPQSRLPLWSSVALLAGTVLLAAGVAIALVSR